MGKKRGHKKNHSNFGHSFKKGFKYGMLGASDAMGKIAPVVGLISPELGGVMAGGSELEKNTVASIDSIGAKNPEKRYDTNMAYSAV